MNFEFLSRLNKHSLVEEYFPKSVDNVEVSIDSCDGSGKIDDPNSHLRANDPDRTWKISQCEIKELSFVINTNNETYYAQYIFKPSLDFGKNGYLDESMFKTAISQYPFVLYNDDGDVINDDTTRQKIRGFIVKYISVEDPREDTTLENVFDFITGR